MEIEKEEKSRLLNKKCEEGKGGQPALSRAGTSSSKGGLKVGTKEKKNGNNFLFGPANCREKKTGCP